MASDSSKYEVISRCLQAAGGAVPADQPQSLYLVTEEDNELMESLVEGSVAMDQDRIATEVKANTPVAYLYKNANERYAFCVDDNDVLKFYRFHQEWEESTLGALPEQKVHPNGKLGACFLPDGIALYFQDPSGNLSGIEERNGTWKALDSISVDARDGTPLKLSYSDHDSKFYLYYLGADTLLHYRIVSHASGESQDYIYPGSKFEKSVENLIVFRGEGDQQTEAYFLTPSVSRTSTSVFTRVDGDGTRATLGYAKGGEFEPDADAQCFGCCYCPIIVYYVCRPRYCYCW